MKKLVARLLEGLHDEAKREKRKYIMLNICNNQHGSLQTQDVRESKLKRELLGALSLLHGWDQSLSSGQTRQ